MTVSANVFSLSSQDINDLTIQRQADKALLRRFLKLINPTDTLIIQMIPGIKEVKEKWKTLKGKVRFSTLDSYVNNVAQFDAYCQEHSGYAALRLHWYSYNDHKDSLRTFIIEYDADANGQPMSYERQQEILSLSGLPISYAVATGNKSIHFYITLEEGVKASYWDRLAEAIHLHLVAVSGEKPDHGVLTDRSRSIRLPGTQHNKTERYSTILKELGTHQAVKLEDVLAVVDIDAVPVSPTKSSASRRNIDKTLSSATVEQLQESIDGTRKLNPLFPCKSPERQEKLLKRVEDAYKDARRGINGNITAFLTGLKMGEMSTTHPVENLINTCIDTGAKYMIAQNTIAGSDWDVEDYKQATLNGLKTSWSNQVNQVLGDTRTLTDAQQINVRFLDVKHLDHPNKGVFIKSPVGTGKTQVTKEYVKSLIEKNPNTRILFVTHRVTLGKGVYSWSKELDFTSYDTIDAEGNKFIGAYDRHIITFDQLRKFKNIRTVENIKQLGYDLIIIDEVDQAIEYLLTGIGTTIADERVISINVFRTLLSKAGRFIATSATVSDLEVECLKKWGNTTDVICIENTQKTSSKTIYMLPTEQDAIAKIEELLTDGKNVLVAMDLKNGAETLRNKLKAAFPSLSIEAYHSERKDTLDAENIAESVKQYQCLISSPSLGTGVDINNDHFDVVVGIFTNKDVTAYDCYQHLNRVRKPNTNTIYAYAASNSHSWLNEESIKVSNSLIERTEVDVMQLTASQFILDRQWEEYKEEVTGLQAAYLTRRNHECYGKAAKLWQISKEAGNTMILLPSKLDESEKVEVKKEVSEARKVTKEAKIEHIFTAYQLTELEAKKLKNKPDLTDAERVQKERYYISVVHLKKPQNELTRGDIKWYLAGGKEPTRIFKLLNCLRSEAVKQDTIECNKHQINGGYDAKYHARTWDVLHEVMDYVTITLKKDRYSAEDFQALHKVLCKDSMKQRLITGLGLSFNVKTPITLINSLLSRLGYNVKSIQLSGGKRVYTATLDDAGEALQARLMPQWVDGTIKELMTDDCAMTATELLNELTKAA